MNLELYRQRLFSCRTQVSNGKIEMLQAVDRQAVLEFQSRFTEIASLLEFWVFGSRARSDATEESDLDIFIYL